jgi:ribosomal protein S18 acetylase RimI-like enzyme
MPQLIKILSPSEFSKAEIGNFEALVRQDPQVDPNGLRGRINSSARLGMVFEDAQLVATIALKSNQGHRTSIEKKSGTKLPVADYCGEIGYLHIAKALRGKGLARILLNEFISEIGEEGLFATIQSQNSASIKTFESAGFQKSGEPWPSSQTDDDVQLYIRPARKGDEIP